MSQIDKLHSLQRRSSALYRKLTIPAVTALGLTFGYNQIFTEFMDITDANEGPIKRISPAYQPLFLYDSEAETYNINRTKLEWHSSISRIDPEELEIATRAMLEFANGDDGAFHEFYNMMDETSDGLYFIAHEVFTFERERFDRFLELAEESASTEQISRINSFKERYEVEHSTVLLGAYINDFGDMLSLRSNVDYTQSILEVWQIVVDNTESLSDEEFQLELIAIHSQLVQISNDKNQRLTRFAGIYSTYGESVSSRVSLAQRSLQELVHSRYPDVNSVMDLPIFSTLPARIAQVEQENFDYWKEVVENLGIQTDNISTLRDLSIEEDTELMVGGTTTHSGFTLDDVDPNLDGIQVPTRTFVHEVAHALEPHEELLKDFTRKMIECANGVYESDYPEFTNWCREVFYGFPPDRSISYLGLAHSVSDDDLNAYLEGDTDLLQGQFLNRTINMPAEMFATTMDTIWAYFNENQIPPAILSFAEEIFSDTEINKDFQRRHGMKIPLFSLIMIFTTEMVLFTGQKIRNRRRGMTAPQT